jgi:DNA processing protein
MNLITEDIFLLLSSSLDLQRFKILVKKIYDKTGDLSFLLSGAESGSETSLSFFDKEKIDFIKKEIKKTSLEQVKKDLEYEAVSFIAYSDKHYPKKLKEMNDSPLGLFYRGNLDLFNSLSVAIVGTRNPTNYGIKITKRITELFSEKKLTIISGLASGIDSCAHEEAIILGKTIAVLGTGLDRIYPQENKKLFDKIIKNDSLIISEYPLGAEGMPWNFPQRNRIISALSDAVIVVEGNLQSGSLITARFAIKQDKPLFALPGPIDSAESNGPNMLIKSGVAELLTSVDDVFEKISDLKSCGVQVQIDFKEKTKSLEGLNEAQKSIYKLLDKESKSFDALVNDTKLNSNELLRNLSMLELKGYVEKKLSGNYEVIDN